MGALESSPVWLDTLKEPDGCMWPGCNRGKGGGKSSIQHLLYPAGICVHLPAWEVGPDPGAWGHLCTCRERGSPSRFLPQPLPTWAVSTTWPGQGGPEPSCVCACHTLLWPRSSERAAGSPGHAQGTSGNVGEVSPPWALVFSPVDQGWCGRGGVWSVSARALRVGSVFHCGPQPGQAP